MRLHGPPPRDPAHPRLFPSEPCGFEATYLELASAVKEQYPGIQIESRLGGTGERHDRPRGQPVPRTPALPR